MAQLLTSRYSATRTLPMPLQSVSDQSQAVAASSDSPVCPFASMCTVSGFTIRSWRAAEPPLHQTPAPAGSTDPLIGPQQILTASEQPASQTAHWLDNKSVKSRQTAGWLFFSTADRDGNLIGHQFPRRRKRLSRLVGNVLCGWSESHVISNGTEDTYVRLYMFTQLPSLLEFF